MRQQLEGIEAEQRALTLAVAELARDDGDEAQRVRRAEVDNTLVQLVVRVTQLEQALEERARPPARPPVARPDPAVVYRAEVGDSPVKGSDRALVTIVMWTDFQCPFCARVQATLRSLEKKYGKKVRFVHKHNPLPFHDRAMPAALAAEAAHRQGKFWRMSDKLFDHQRELSDKNFRRWAKGLGLDARRFARDMDDPELRRRVERDQAQGAKLGARGTPAFFINGRFLSGAQPLENFSQLIDEELVKARRLVERGVARGEVYAVTIADGRDQV